MFLLDLRRTGLTRALAAVREKDDPGDRGEGLRRRPRARRDEGRVLQRRRATHPVAIEAARLALEQDDRPLAPEAFRAGFETVEDCDASGLFAPGTVTAEDHGGGGKTGIETRDGGTRVSRTVAADQDVVREVAEKNSAGFKAGTSEPEPGSAPIRRAGRRCPDPPRRPALRRARRTANRRGEGAGQGDA